MKEKLSDSLESKLHSVTKLVEHPKSQVVAYQTRPYLASLTHQWLITLDELDDLDGFFLFVFSIGGQIRQAGHVVLLRHHVVGG